MQGCCWWWQGVCVFPCGGRQRWNLWFGRELERQKHQCCILFRLFKIPETYPFHSQKRHLSSILLGIDWILPSLMLKKKMAWCLKENKMTRLILVSWMDSKGMWHFYIAQDFFIMESVSVGRRHKAMGQRIMENSEFQILEELYRSFHLTSLQPHTLSFKRSTTGLIRFFPNFERVQKMA